jgi:hypothetical protein
MPDIVDDLSARLDAVERSVSERIDQIDAGLRDLRQATDGGFGRLERRLIQLVQGLVASRQSARGRDRYTE